MCHTILQRRGHTNLWRTPREIRTWLASLCHCSDKVPTSAWSGFRMGHPRNWQQLRRFCRRWNTNLCVQTGQVLNIGRELKCLILMVKSTPNTWFNQFSYSIYVRDSFDFIVVTVNDFSKNIYNNSLCYYQECETLFPKRSLFGEIILIASELKFVWQKFAMLEKAQTNLLANCLTRLTFYLKIVLCGLIELFKFYITESFKKLFLLWFR